jgi:hypothetical protein
MPPDLLEVTRPRANAAARERLDSLATFLEECGRFPEAQAIREFQAGRYRSLDEAFGVVAPRRRKGAPKKLESILELGHRIERYRLQGKTWAGVADQLSEASPHGKDIDERQSRRIYRQLQTLRKRWWSVPFMTAELMAQVLDLVGLPDERQGQ